MLGLEADQYICHVCAEERPDSASLARHIHYRHKNVKQTTDRGLETPVGPVSKSRLNKHFDVKSINEPSPGTSESTSNIGIKSAKKVTLPSTPIRPVPLSAKGHTIDAEAGNKSTPATPHSPPDRSINTIDKLVKLQGDRTEKRSTRKKLPVNYNEDEHSTSSDSSDVEVLDVSKTFPSRTLISRNTENLPSEPCPKLSLKRNIKKEPQTPSANTPYVGKPLVTELPKKKLTKTVRLSEELQTDGPNIKKKKTTFSLEVISFQTPGDTSGEPESDQIYWDELLKYSEQTSEGDGE